MDVRGHLYGSLLLLAILSSPAHGDYIDHLDQEEGTDYNATGVKIVIVYGVVLAIQVIVFFIFACKAWDAVFKSRSVAEDSESQLTNEFPFLPSYEMAMNEARTSQQSVASRDTVDTTVDDGVILGIASPGGTAFPENQRNESETNHCVVNIPRCRGSLDDGVVLEIEESITVVPVEENVNSL